MGAQHFQTPAHPCCPPEFFCIRGFKLSFPAYPLSASWFFLMNLQLYFLLFFFFFKVFIYLFDRQ